MTVFVRPETSGVSLTFGPILFWFLFFWILVRLSRIVPSIGKERQSKDKKLTIINIVGWALMLSGITSDHYNYAPIIINALMIFVGFLMCTFFHNIIPKRADKDL